MADKIGESGVGGVGEEKSLSGDFASNSLNAFRCIPFLFLRDFLVVFGFSLSLETLVFDFFFVLRVLVPLICRIIVEFHRFLIMLSVRPGKCLEISAHLLPSFA